MSISLSGSGPDPGVALADRFYALARRHRKAGGSAAPPPWAGTFRRLVKVFSAEKVGLVLAWLESRAGGVDCPRVWTPAVLSARMPDLLRAAKDDLDTRDTVSPQSLRLAERAASLLPFPPELEAALPAVAERTSREWREFYRRGTELVSTFTIDDREKWRAARFWTHRVEVSVTETWLYAVSARYGHLDHFTNHPLTAAFRPSSPLFRGSVWQPWSLAFCGRAAEFDWLLEEINRGQGGGEEKAAVPPPA